MNTRKSSTQLAKELSELIERKKQLETTIKEQERKATDARKYALAGALLKRAETETRFHQALMLLWEDAKAARPKPFEGVEPPPAPQKAPPQA